jgi:signal transduction histidine kinase
VRRRLIALLLLLLAAVLAALSLPLARSLAAGRQQEMFVDRLQDTNQFAAGAQQATTAVDQEALRADLARYAELYGITAAVVSRGGTTWAVAGRLEALDEQQVAERISQARAGHQSTAPPTVWPWSDRPIVVAVPVVRADNVIAVAVTVSATTSLRAGTGRDLGLLLLADLTALALLVVVAGRLARWVLRPVDVLDAAARQISTGTLTTRVDATTGPVELRRLAATFNGMAQAVELAMQRQEAFVADASHQLRNPLMALVLRLEALGMNLDEEQRRQLEPAREEATRLGVILDELLELATALHLAARPAAIDVGLLVRARLDAWQPVADRGAVRLRGPANGVPLTGLADPALIASALDSVLDNAVKFSPPGGEVAVDLAGEAATVRIDVVDAGPGLSEDDLAHIGDRFWRSTAHQNVPGCGLGLSIARALLDATGGSLSFARVTPHGLHVTLRLPRAS